MSVIVFDLLVPTSHLGKLTTQFKALGALLLRDGKVEEVEVTVADKPRIDPAVLAQLRTGCIEEHEEQGLPFQIAELLPSRFEIRLSTNGSLNQLAMLYSRLLTPAANLPADAFALADEKAYEVPARFPWTVQIYP